MPDPIPAEETQVIQPPVETPAAAPVPEPDINEVINKLLTDKDKRQQLFNNEELRREIDHRATSEAGRRATKLAQAELERLDAQRRSEEEARKIQDMDPFELGEKVKKEQAEQVSAQKALAQGLAQVGQTIYQIVQANPDLTDEERHELHPANPKFQSFADYWGAVTDAIGRKRAKELAKELAKSEAEALYNERLAKERDGDKSPAALPAGTSAGNDEQFIADYADGKSSDHARYLRIRGRT